MNIVEGKFEAKGLSFGIVLSRFNSFLSEKLLEGALDCLNRHGAEDSRIKVVKVPGSFEIPFAAMRLAKSGKYDAVICLGVLIRGETPHFDYIASQTAAGIGRVGLDTSIPTLFGVVTANTLEQAIERCGTKAGNKGFDAALAAIEMANLNKELGSV